MKKLFLLAFIFFLVVNALNAQVFQFNSLGFLPGQTKVVSISKTFESFEIINAENNELVFKGEAEGPYEQADVNCKVWNADFSKLQQTGTFLMKIDSGELSPEFKIADDVYNASFKTSMRAMYLWRCGTAVSGDFNGEHYEHAACHLQDGWLDSIGIPNQQKDGTGGWHDAGDHGKYVVNAGITVGMMFMAWDQFNDQLKNVQLDLPETAPGFPDFLKELKWEIDWLLKMQYPDGSGKVSHKLTRTNFSGFIMPEDDDQKRYFTDWSSAATADFVAMMAQAARYFKPYDQAYAQKCLDAALVSYQFLSENPESKQFRQRFGTGGYQSADADDRLWAAAEMWETTGKKVYLKDFEAQLTELEKMADENWDWGNVKNMGTYTYVLSTKKGRNKKLLAKAQAAVIEVADTIVAKGKKDVFNRPLGTRYYWGCNGTVARQVLNLYVANQLQADPKYRETSLNAIGHLFGRNVYGRSYVTGIGMNPPMNPHDRRSGADGIVAPWPGYIVGGGQHATDWKDEQASFQTNEIAINWQAALVYALAGFLK
ncbi:MAG: glycoside hydrolase family 9 protein [Prolixibacteraceae bacterium]